MLGLKQYALPFTALLIAAGAVAQSADDTLTLVSGEILRGNLLDIEDGVVTFRTRHGSRTFLPVDQVQSLKTSNARVVTMAGGQSVTGALSMDGKNLIVSAGERQESLDMADVSGIAPVKRSNTGTNSTVASIGTGLLFREGNRSSVDLYARIDLDRTAQWYEWNWNTLLALDRADDFPRYFRSEFDWRHTPSETRVPFVLLGLERDLDAAIDVRAFAAAGLEQRFLKRPLHELHGGVGIGLRYDDIDPEDTLNATALDELRWRLRAREFTGNLSGSSTDIDILFRVIYKAQLHDKLVFYDELRVMPSLTDFGDIRASYDSGLAWSLLDGLELNLQLRIDYDDEPPFAQLDRWRAAVGAGLRIRFGTR